MTRSTELVAGLMGIIKAGGAYLPLDIAYPEERVRFMIEDAGASIMLTERSVADKLGGSGCLMVYMDADRNQISRQSGENIELEVAPDNLAYVIYTSGSTGLPKGVAIEHRNTLAFLNWAGDVFSSEEMRGVLASTSTCFDLSVFELFCPLVRGGTVILIENALRLSESSETGAVRLINTVPSAMAELVRAGAIPESARMVNLAGEVLSGRLAQQFCSPGGRPARQVSRRPGRRLRSKTFGRH